MTETNTTRLAPGKFRATTPLSVSLYRGDQELSYTEYAAGEFFEIPATVSQHWHGIKKHNADLEEFGAIDPKWVETAV